MVERFLKQTHFTSTEDFREHLQFIIPEQFNFAYDVMDVWAEEQPDKMDGMKVTIVPVDASIPQQGIEPNGIGLDFPKFPHPKASSTPK